MLSSQYKTIDGHEIVDGLRVWDYDLKPGTIDLQSSEPHEEVNQNDGSKELWFDVRPDNHPNPNARKMMSAKRVWVRHPTTGSKA
jgi:hypothetical protein